MKKDWKAYEIKVLINLYYTKIPIAKIADFFKVTEQSINKVLKRTLVAENNRETKKTFNISKKKFEHVMSLKEAFLWIKNDGFPVSTKNFVTFTVPQSAVPISKEQLVLLINQRRLAKGLPIIYVREVTDGGF